MRQTRGRGISGPVEAPEAGKERYVLRLYITGLTPNSTRAITNIRALCHSQLPGSYDLRVIDLYQHPGVAKRAQVIAAPTLVKELPAPLRRLVGDLSKMDHVLWGLDIHPRPDEPARAKAQSALTPSKESPDGKGKQRRPAGPRK